VGNHADVIKHLCLIATLEHYKNKDKPFCLFDTHAGAGLYALTDPEVQKNKEFATGTSQFSGYQAKNKILVDYLRCLLSFETHGILPGSPAIGLNCIRDQDSIVLMELHPSECQKLKVNLRDYRINVHARDGFEGIVALSPPLQKRGVVLIDPPYEQLSEYSKVVSSVTKILSRWQNACLLIWYPLLGSRAGAKSEKSEWMLNELKLLTKEPILNIQLCIDDPQKNQAMYGSGVAVINSPWQLDETLSATMTEVAEILSPTSYSVKPL
jgi:23S rRNA (adenine2030-N6)-methyltransferase